jgi:ADP-heptose:LPS heptosyltransferase
MPTFNVNGTIISSDESYRIRTEAALVGIELSRAAALVDPAPILPEGAIYGPRKRVLVLRTGGLGDVLCVTPLIRAIASQGILVDVVTCYPDLFLHNTHVNHVFVPRNEPNPDDYDCWIDLNNYVERPEHVTQHRPSAFARAVHVELNGDYGLDYTVTAAERTWANKLMSTNPYMSRPVGYVWDSTTANRNWSDGTHDRVLSVLTNAKYPVIVLSSKQVSYGVKSFRIYNASGKYDIRETAALMDRCAAIITPDTGLFHVASALRKPILTYFGAFPVEERMTTDNITLINQRGYCPFKPCRSYNCAITNGEPPCLEVDTNSILKALGGIYHDARR